MTSRESPSQSLFDQLESLGIFGEERITGVPETSPEQSKNNTPNNTGENSKDRKDRKYSPKRKRVLGSIAATCTVFVAAASVYGANRNDESNGTGEMTPFAGCDVIDTVALTQVSDAYPGVDTIMPEELEKAEADEDYEIKSKKLYFAPDDVEFTENNITADALGLKLPKETFLSDKSDVKDSSKVTRYPQAAINRPVDIKLCQDEEADNIKLNDGVAKIDKSQFYLAGINNHSIDSELYGEFINAEFADTKMEPTYETVPLIEPDKGDYITMPDGSLVTRAAVKEYNQAMQKPEDGKSGDASRDSNQIIENEIFHAALETVMYGQCKADITIAADKALADYAESQAEALGLDLEDIEFIGELATPADTFEKALGSRSLTDTDYIVIAKPADPETVCESSISSSVAMQSASGAKKIMEDGKNDE